VLTLVKFAHVFQKVPVFRDQFYLFLGRMIILQPVIFKKPVKF
jgi:hypothetical protein